MNPFNKYALKLATSVMVLAMSVTSFEAAGRGDCINKDGFSPDKRCKENGGGQSRRKADSFNDSYQAPTRKSEPYATPTRKTETYNDGYSAPARKTDTYNNGYTAPARKTDTYTDTYSKPAARAQTEKALDGRRSENRIPGLNTDKTPDMRYNDNKRKYGKTDDWGRPATRTQSESAPEAPKAQPPTRTTREPVREMKPQSTAAQEKPKANSKDRFREDGGLDGRKSENRIPGLNTDMTPDMRYDTNKKIAMREEIEREQAEIQRRRGDSWSTNNSSNRNNNGYGNGYNNDYNDRYNNGYNDSYNRGGGYGRNDYGYDTRPSYPSDSYPSNPYPRNDEGRTQSLPYPQERAEDRPVDSVLKEKVVVQPENSQPQTAEVPMKQAWTKAADQSRQKMAGCADGETVTELKDSAQIAKMSSVFFEKASSTGKQAKTLVGCTSRDQISRVVELDENDGVIRSMSVDRDQLGRVLSRKVDDGDASYVETTKYDGEKVAGMSVQRMKADRIVSECTSTGAEHPDKLEARDLGANAFIDALQNAEIVPDTGEQHEKVRDLNEKVKGQMEQRQKWQVKLDKASQDSWWNWFKKNMFGRTLEKRTAKPTAKLKDINGKLASLENERATIENALAKIPFESMSSDAAYQAGCLKSETAVQAKNPFRDLNGNLFKGKDSGASSLLTGCISGGKLTKLNEHQMGGDRAQQIGESRTIDFERPNSFDTIKTMVDGDRKYVTKRRERGGEINMVTNETYGRGPKGEVNLLGSCVSYPDGKRINGGIQSGGFNGGNTGVQSLQ